MQVTEHTPGTFCWTELSTNDGEAAKKFYAGLFGWSPVDMPMGEGEVYTMLTLNGNAAAALFTDKTCQTPPHWNSYISTTNIDETAQKAKSLGGQLAMEPFDVMTAGRMAVVQDPEGTFFSLWQSREHIGAQVINEVGAVCWTELATRNSAQARTFYSSLFGWDYKTFPVDADSAYTEIHTTTSQPFGGMMEMTETMAGIPSHWMPYFQVADTDASLAKVQEMGGSVVVPATDIPNTGRFGVIQDPQGATCAIIQMVGPA